MVDRITGYRSIAIAIAIAATLIGGMLGVLDADTTAKTVGLLGAVFGATFAAKVQRGVQALEDVLKDREPGLALALLSAGLVASMLLFASPAWAHPGGGLGFDVGGAILPFAVGLTVGLAFGPLRTTR